MGRFSYLRGGNENNDVQPAPKAIRRSDVHKMMVDIRRMLYIGDYKGALDYVQRTIRDTGGYTDADITSAKN